MRVPFGSSLQQCLEAGSRLDPSSGCVIWFKRCQDGYPFLKYKGEAIAARRVAWMVHIGPIPDGKYVLHECKNQLCINSDHLFLGTKSEVRTFHGPSLQERLEAGSIPEPNSGCWIWLRNIEGSGYPYFKYQGRNLHGNRASWEVYRGPIPAGLCVLHRCDNRLCVNPDHLFLGTKKDNAIDMFKKGRANRPNGERHSGSKLTEETVLDILTSPVSISKLAKQYEVSRTTISSVRNGRTWHHMKGTFK